MLYRGHGLQSVIARYKRSCCCRCNRVIAPKLLFFEAGAGSSYWCKDVGFGGGRRCLVREGRVLARGREVAGILGIGASEVAVLDGESTREEHMSWRYRGMRYRENRWFKLLNGWPCECTALWCVGYAGGGCSWTGTLAPSRRGMG